MTDTVDRETRSRIMASVRRVDTRPEMIVRKSLHRLGFRYRISDRGLPGSPDLKLTRFRVVVFVNGCFWHRHDGCRYATTPSSNQNWWVEKFAQNVSRDAEKTQRLLQAGWRVLVVWECAVRKPGAKRDRNLDRLAELIRSNARIGTIPDAGSVGPSASSREGNRRDS